MFFHKLFFIINTRFSTLHERIYVGCIKLLAEVSEVVTHAVLQLVVFHKTASSECVFHGGKNESRRVLIRDVGDMKENSLPHFATASLLRRQVCGLALSCKRNS